MDQANWAVPRDDFRVQQDVRVRFNEIDGQNIVFSGNYLIYADIGVTEYFRALGEGQPGPYFHQYGTDIREVHSEIDYHAPARLDELITIAARVSHFGRTSFTLHCAIFRGAERLTGYHVGGISPFGQKKRVPTALEQTALRETSVFLNGGQRGLQIQIDPNDASKALGAIVADVLA